MTRNPLSLVFHAPHGLNQTFPSENGKTPEGPVPTRQAHIIDDQGMVVRVPAISANAIRGRLRRAIAEAVYDAVFGEDRAVQRMNWHVAALLFAGGASMSGYVATPEALAILQDLLPVYLMGGQFFTTQIPGRLIAHDVLMVTAKTPPDLFELGAAQDFIADHAPGALRVGADAGADLDLVHPVRFVKRADPAILLDDQDQPVDPRMELDAHARASLAKVRTPKGATSDTVRQQNLFGYEVSAGNSWWAGGLDVLGDPAHPEMARWAQSLVRWAAERVFDGQGALGGKLSAGYGLVTGTVLAPDGWPDTEAWRDWLDAYADTHQKYPLAALLGAGSPLADMARAAANSKGKQKQNAKKDAPEAADPPADSVDDGGDEMEIVNA